MTLLTVPMIVGVALLVLELWFRRWHRGKYGRDYFVSIKFKWSRGHVVPHPFLTFAYKKDEVIDVNQTIPYALWPNRYRSFHQPLRLNNVGHFGNDFVVEKKARTLRVACVGSSGTANNIADETRDWSYPEELRIRLLADPALRKLYDDIEVYNCGIGGWTTVDVMVNYAINIAHFKPDIVVFYQGLNDLPLHLMDSYSFDYTHGRRNFGEVIHKVKWGYWFPKLPWWHSYEFVKDRLFGTGNTRNEVLARIETSKPDYARPYRPLHAEEMALRNLLILARAHGARVVMSSYVFYLHNTSDRNRKLCEGVALENQLYRRMAEEFGLPFVDLDALVPREKDYFVDAVHFTPKGMCFIADHIAAAVAAEALSLNQPDLTGASVVG